MRLKYDPADNLGFWQAISQLPGCPPEAQQQPVKQMLFESGALFKLPEVLKGLNLSPKQPLLVVLDATPMLRGPHSLKPLLLKTLQQAGWQVQPLLLEGDRTGQVHTDLKRIQAVKGRLTAHTIALSLGSGTVTDITKHACFLFEQEQGTHVPYIAYQTANSVSAYTSNMVPLFVEGLKRTVPSRYPDALVCDLETLRDAPYDMTVAGVGDLLPLYTGYADWYLAMQLGMDPSYTPFVAELLGPVDDILLHSARDIHSTTLEGMSILAKLISLVGLALSLFHSTAPLSGYDHIFSHTLDLLNTQLGVPLPLHGSQVAASIIFLNPLYRMFIEDFDPQAIDIESCFPNVESMAAHVPGIFQPIDPSGKVGLECWADYGQKLERWHDQRENLATFLSNWEEIRQVLDELTRPSELLVHILRAVGSPLWWDDLEPPILPEQVKFAFINSPLIRNRLTLGDLLIFFGWDREVLWQHAWDHAQRLVKG